MNTLIVWGAIAALVVLTILLLAVLQKQEATERTQPGGPKLVPGSAEWHADLEELTLCTGCGCRHKNRWMGWNSMGQFRCIVCCDTEGSDNERIPT